MNKPIGSTQSINDPIPISPDEEKEISELVSASKFVSSIKAANKLGKVKARPRLSKAVWAEIVELWELGELSQRQLAERYRVSQDTISQGLRARKAVYGRKAAEAAKAASERAGDDPELLMRRIRETKDEHYRMSYAYNRLAFGEIKKANEAGKPVADAYDNLKAIKLAMEISAKAREERYAVLGLDKDSVVDVELPELPIRDMTAEEINDVKMRAERALREVSGEIDELMGDELENVTKEVLDSIPDDEDDSDDDLDDLDDYDDEDDDQ